MLLRFRVANYRSIRDVMELSLVTSQLTGAKPVDEDWISVTTRVAGIYGANASGKSTVLDALDFLTAAVAKSATLWGDRNQFPHSPFELDRESRGRTSLFEIDFVLAGVRFTYGFESDSRGIPNEWLYSYPTGRKRVLFERHGFEGSDIDFGRTLDGENMRIARLLRPTALYLSTAANSNHKFLVGIHHWISRHIRYAQYTEANRKARLRWIRNILEDEKMLAKAVGLLRFADLGITNMILDVEDFDDRLVEMLKRVMDGIDDATHSSLDREQLVNELKKNIKFVHSSSDSEETFSLPLEMESSGTIAWLALSIPALTCLRNGEVLAVDELDASLHPRLAAALIEMFKDPELNRKGAQLLFTSHETALLGQTSGSPLSKDEIWFTEKGADGATAMFALSEFPVRPTDNVERRYLQGRYGAIPMISQEELHSVVLEDAQ
ncbi:AAA family ATPase [Acrocarpospora catenulata]|uniref:AAA family ATPase n=1 Tax=Acrocarpospora catenulata TaxID=2836182 RepID=UPI001BDB6793|nr:ATP-binding protein [Acrocarpospora catenulata]